MGNVIKGNLNGFHSTFYDYVFLASKSNRQLIHLPKTTISTDVQVHEVLDDNKSGDLFAQFSLS